MSIRYAEEGDIPSINAFVAKSIQILHVEHYTPEEIKAAVRLAYGVDWQLIRDRTYYIFEVDGIAVAAGGWSFRQTIGGSHGPDEPASPRLDPTADAARIRAFYVDPAFARRGIGSQLLAACELAARKAGFGRAELTSTLQAVSFYAAHGYGVVEPLELGFAEGFKLRTMLMSKVL